MSDQTPYYRAHLFVCCHHRPPDHPRGGCADRGGEALAAYLKAKVKAHDLPRVRVNTAGCLHRCRLGPVLVIYPEGVWYGVTSEADLDEIVSSHLIAGRPVVRLILPGRVDDDNVPTHHHS